MANPDNITLRSEKGSFLTFEEMDLNMTELQNQIIEYNQFLLNDFNPLEEDHTTLRTEWTNFQTEVYDRVSVTENYIAIIQNDQTVQDNRIAQNESDILALQLGGGLQYKGDWVSTESYSIGEVVTYTDGLDYISVSNSNSQEPVSGTNNQYWIVLTTKAVAEFTSYDNSISGLLATNVQEALDEIKSNTDALSDWVDVSTSTTLSANSRLAVDFTTGPLTLTLPATPDSNDFVQFYTSAGDATDSVIARNGSTIMGLAEDLTINYDAKALHLVFNGTTWRVVR